jgi:hypothetical protein
MRGAPLEEGAPALALLNELVATGVYSGSPSKRERQRMKAIQRCLAEDFAQQLMAWGTESLEGHPSMGGEADAPLPQRLGSLFAEFEALDVERQGELMDALLALAAQLVAASTSEGDATSSDFVAHLATTCRAVVDVLNIHAAMKGATLDKVFQTQVDEEIGLIAASGDAWADAAMKVATVRDKLVILKPRAIEQLTAARTRMEACRAELRATAAKQQALVAERDDFNSKQTVLVEICRVSLKEQREKQAHMAANSVCGGLCVTIPKRICRRTVYLAITALLVVGIALAVIIFCSKGFAFVREWIAAGEDSDVR